MSLCSSLSPSLLTPNNSSLPHHERPGELHNLRVVLVDSPAVYLDYPVPRPARRGPDFHDVAASIDRVPGKDRLEKLRVFNAEHESVGARLPYQKSCYQAQSEEAVDDRPPPERFSREVLPRIVRVEMNLIVVVGHQREPDVVLFSDSPPDPPFHPLSDPEVFEVLAELLESLHLI